MLRTPDFPIVQISLDLTSIDEALETAAIAVAAGVDWLEAGTPLLLAEGLHAVEKLRGRFPDHPIVADLKTMDGGYLEAEMMAKAGASSVVVMGRAHEATIRRVVDAGREHGIMVMGDNLAAEDRVVRDPDVGQPDLGAVEDLAGHLLPDHEDRRQIPLQEERNQQGDPGRLQPDSDRLDPGVGDGLECDLLDGHHLRETREHLQPHVDRAHHLDRIVVDVGGDPPPLLLRAVGRALEEPLASRMPSAQVTGQAPGEGPLDDGKHREASERKRQDLSRDPATGSDGRVKAQV